MFRNGEYDIDLIAKRDKREKLNSTVIKRWNVVFEKEKEPVPAENASVEEAPAEDSMSEEEKEKARMAQEIIDRLNAEAAADEAVKQAEIEAAKLQSEETFNSTTGAHSGTYGMGAVSDDEQQMINSIMAEKSDALHKLIDETVAES